ncbi:hypothetical protein KPL70_004060 [Citrus sinensis]|nr:hypothetical protein KPL70_004060 [Citrus sinensis]
MLKKLLKVHKRTTPFPKVPPKPATGAASTPSESPSALKIVHAGGFVECYYMAIPAVIILEKYPSCKLGRREVFRRPWDSVVRPEELLTLGEKFFLVPRRTVRKLRRRVKKLDGHREVSSNSFASKSCVDVCVDKLLFLLRKLLPKGKVLLRFVGIEEKDSHLEDDPGNKSLNSRPHEAKRRPRNAAAASWRPSLVAICEKK